MEYGNLSELKQEMEEDRKEWIESLEVIRHEFGDAGVREILRTLQDHALQAGVMLNEATLNTPYINTISVSEQPLYPGDLEMEKRVENIIRWNAMAMVMQAYDQGTGVGGHIATYASAATVLETGFNHCFRARTKHYGGDMVLAQPHAAPGIYARAYLEGRLTDSQMENFRRELGEGGDCVPTHIPVRCRTSGKCPMHPWVFPPSVPYTGRVTPNTWKTAA